MVKSFRPVINNRFLRNLIRGLLGLMLLDGIISSIVWSTQAMVGFPEIYGIANSFFRVLPWGGPGYLTSGIMIVIRITILCSIPILLSIWVYRSLRNLQAMGIHTRLEPRWILFSWLIPPLLIMNFPMMVHDLIHRNHHLYRLLGRRKGDKIRSEPLLHRSLSFWMAFFWFFVLLTFIQMPELLGFSGTYLGLAIEFLALTGPFLLGILFLQWGGKLEDRVLLVWDRGDLSKWREEMLKSAHLIADNSDSPEWYVDREDLDMEIDKDGIFQDQQGGGLKPS